MRNKVPRIMFSPTKENRDKLIAIASRHHLSLSSVLNLILDGVDVNATISLLSKGEDDAEKR